MNRLVPLLARILPAALVAALAAAVAPAAHASTSTPYARTTPATGVSDTAATVTGVIVRGSGTLYQFEYGIDRYDKYTPIKSIGSSSSERPVSAVLTGLTPGTVYHFRLVALGWGGSGIGADQTFTTGPAVPVAPVAAPAPAPVAPAIPAPVAPAPLPVAPPVIGKTMNVAPVAGTVTVKAPGQSAFTPLAANGSVPVGAVVDTRAGTVQVTSALPAGGTQAGTFHGAVFQVRQAATGSGMTDLVLRGGDFAACPKRGSRASGRAAAATKRKPPVRKLWGQDKGGRFRTHGRNSVATVRGTRWVTTDTCAGTRTTVTEGAVAVRDLRRKKTVVVRAGRSYLARSR
jgi:hypothetical protein